MLTLDEIKEALKDRRPEQVAADTGLAMSTVGRYQRGEVVDPPHSVMVTLSEYLSPKKRGK